MKDIYSIPSRNPRWKGDSVGYGALHGWVRKQKGRANRCSMKDNTCSNKFEWSNISKNYTRDLNDFRPLCASHHRRLDISYLKGVLND